MIASHELSRMGAEARRRQGMLTDIRVLATIIQKPGLSYYSLAKEMGMLTGAVQHSVKRLAANGLVNVEFVQSNSRSKCLMAKVTAT